MGILRDNYERRKNGNILAYETGYVPLVKESFTIITANTGDGKTKFTKHLVFNILEKYDKVKVIWFALEESKEYFIASIVSNYLMTKHNIYLSPAQCLSYVEELDEELIKLIDEAELYAEKLLERIDIVSHITNPTGIYKYCRDYMLTIGKEITNTLGFKTGYKYNDDNELVIVVIDHLTFVTEESGMTEWQSYKKLCKSYLSSQLKDRFKCAIILVQQQNSETDRQEFWQGNTIVNKIKPSLSGLGEYKNSQQDATLVYGIFNPNKYGLNIYNMYDIDVLKDNYRAILVLKDRLFGENKKEYNMFFNGATNEYSKLYPATSKETRELYKTLNKK
ncbi:MAG: hypothetical protein HC917_06390 [Richelia sp. SM2_1_7]|nr:hypothetical protein [Richelia sp. SM2_1_7]